MNIDLAATTTFKDRTGLQDFLLVHRFVHAATAAALATQFNVPVSTFGLSATGAEEAWIHLMEEGKGRTPDSLQNWLKVHADIHNQSYSLLGGSGTVAPDLSVVDFSNAQQYYDWMFVHQSMHAYEYQQLGLT